MRKVQIGIRPRQGGGQIYEVVVQPAQRASARTHLQGLWQTLITLQPQRAGEGGLDSKAQVVELLRFYESQGAFAADAPDESRRYVQDLVTVAAHLLDGGYWLIDLQDGSFQAMEDA